MGAVGGGLIDTETAFAEGSALADALHSLSAVESPNPKQALVSDSFRGRGPSEKDREIKTTQFKHFSHVPSYASTQKIEERAHRSQQ